MQHPQQTAAGGAEATLRRYENYLLGASGLTVLTMLSLLWVILSL